MVGKTERVTMTSGVAPALSGLVLGIGIDGAGTLRQLKVTKCNNSGIIRLSVYMDSGLVIENAQVALSSGVALPSTNLGIASVQTSGYTLVSGYTDVWGFLNFTDRCQIMYTCTSGSVDLTALVDMQKRIIQS